MQNEKAFDCFSKLYAYADAKMGMAPTNMAARANHQNLHAYLFTSWLQEQPDQTGVYTLTNYKAFLKHHSKVEKEQKEKAEQERKHHRSQAGLEETVEETPPANTKESLTHKQQILLLKEIGFFELPRIKDLTLTQKGLLVGALLNRDRHNTEDYIRYANGLKNVPAKFKLGTEANKKAIKVLLDAM